MWLHGWAIVAGVVAAGVPVIIHWLTRPRPLRLPLSTLRFVREAVQQRRTTHRLRDALVLTLRVAAVLLIAAAMARPMIGRQHKTVTSDDAAAGRQRGFTVRTAWKGLACRTRRPRSRRMSFPANSVGLSATRR